MRPRAGLRACLCAFGLAAVLVSAVGPPAHERAAEAAHEDDRAGWVWVSASVDRSATTWQWEHVNLWRCGALTCDNSAGHGTGRGGSNPTEVTTSCRPRAGTDTAAESEGCGGHQVGSSGWRFVGHVMCEVGGVKVHHNETGWRTRCAASGAEKQTGKQVDGSARYSCPTVNGAISDTAHCGTWSECTGNTVPNSTKTACTPCTAPQRPSNDGETCVTPSCPDVDGQPQHRHGTGACEADHPPRVGPDCEAGLTAEVTVTWTYHDSSGNNAQGSKVCGPPDSGGGGGGGGADMSVCAATQTRIRPYGKVYTYPRILSAVSRGAVSGQWVQTPTPLSETYGQVWAPLVIPSNGASIGRAGTPTLNVEAWLGLDFLNADRPVYWAARYDGQANSISAAAYALNSSGVQVGCGTAVIRHAGAGWRLVNLALADPEAATSGTGRGRRTFELAAQPIPDETQPSGFSAWDAWDVWVEFPAARGEPWPDCHRSAWFTANLADARLGVERGWRPYPEGDGRRVRSCGWTVKRWTAIPVEVTDCPDTPPDADGVRRCVLPGV